MANKSIKTKINGEVKMRSVKSSKCSEVKNKTLIVKVSVKCQNKKIKKVESNSKSECKINGQKNKK